MKILEIGPGTEPIEWHGEPAEYVGIDKCYTDQNAREVANDVLLKNPDITKFGLVSCRVQKVDASIPPDAVFLREVMVPYALNSYNLEIFKHAVRLASGVAPVYALERHLPRDSFAYIKRHLANSHNLDARILSPRDVGFNAIWNQVAASRQFTKSARILYVPPQLNIA